MLRRLKPPLSISGDRMPSDSVMAFCTSGVAVAVYSDRQKRCQTRMLIVQVSTGMLNQCRKSKHNLKSAVNRQTIYRGSSLRQRSHQGDEGHAWEVVPQLG